MWSSCATEQLKQREIGNEIKKKINDGLPQLPEDEHGKYEYLLKKLEWSQSVTAHAGIAGHLCMAQRSTTHSPQKKTSFIPPHQCLPFLLAGGSSFCVSHSPMQHPGHEAAVPSSALAQHRLGLARRVSSGAQLQAPKFGILGESSRRSQQCVFCCLHHSLHPAWCLPLHNGPSLLTHVELVTQRQLLLAQQPLSAADCKSSISHCSHTHCLLLPGFP